MKYLVVLMLMIASVTVAAQSHSAQHESIVLNKGKKWKVPIAMMKHITTMEQEIESFRKTKRSDYAVLTKSLNKEIDLLTANCIMKGQGHDELHKWLVPFIGDVKELSQLTQPDELHSKVENLSSEFVRLHQYFE